MTQALFVGRLQEPGTEVAVNLDARSGDSLGQIPQSSRLSVPLCHICIHTPLWTRGQPRLRESTLPTAIHVRPREATEAVRVRSSSGPPSLASPPPRLPVNPLFLSSAQQAADAVRPVNGYLAGSQARTGQSTGSRATRLGCWCPRAGRGVSAVVWKVTVDRHTESVLYLKEEEIPVWLS